MLPGIIMSFKFNLLHRINRGGPLEVLQLQAPTTAGSLYSAKSPSVCLRSCGSFCLDCLLFLDGARMPIERRNAAFS